MSPRYANTNSGKQVEEGPSRRAGSVGYGFALFSQRLSFEDYATMFRAFYGKDPDIGPMLEHRGLTPSK